jgi:regulatory protein
MLTITDIQYRQNRIEVTLDSGETLALPLLASGMFNLGKDRTVDTEEYRQIREESERFLCRQKALDYLSLKNRTSHEIEKYLLKKRFSVHIIREILAGLCGAGYVDDLKYAKSFIENRRSNRLVGKNLLKKELYGKGVPRNTVQKALTDSEYTEDNIDEVYNLAVKKLAGLGGKKNRLQKVSYFLNQRGFDYEIIQRVIQRLRNEHILTEEGASDAQG